ncbi:MAG: alpha/beta hydrolase, partial [Planctomycetota bacterium]
RPARAGSFAPVRRVPCSQSIQKFLKISALKRLPRMLPRLAAKKRTLDVNGVRIYFTDEGRGAAVVLLHGFMVSGYSTWQVSGFTSALFKKRRAITIDVRGHGRSGKPHGQEAYGREMVADVLRVLDHLSIDRAHVVGYSMGGFIALKLLTDHPERLISATFAASGGVREDADFVWSDTVADQLEEGASLNDAMLSAPSLLPPHVEITARQVRMLKAVCSRQDERALLAVLRSWRRLAVPYRQLAASAIPALFVYGSDEIPALRRYLAELEEIMGHAEFCMIDDVNHLTSMFSAEFQKSILKFIEMNSGDRGD